MKKVLFLLGQMTDTHIEWLMNNGTKDLINAGEVLIRKKNPVTNLYIVLSGRLSISERMDNVDEIAQIGVGEVLGEMSFLEARAPSVNVTAKTDCELFVIPKIVVEEKMKQDVGFKASFYHALALFLSDRLRNTTNQLGYGDPIEDDIVEEEILDSVGHAGNGFDQILKRFAEI